MSVLLNSPPQVVPNPDLSHEQNPSPPAGRRQQLVLVSHTPGQSQKQCLYISHISHCAPKARSLSWPVELCAVVTTHLCARLSHSVVCGKGREDSRLPIFVFPAPNTESGTRKSHSTYWLNNIIINHLYLHNCIHSFVHFFSLFIHSEMHLRLPECWDYYRDWDITQPLKS